MSEPRDAVKSNGKENVVESLQNGTVSGRASWPTESGEARAAQIPPSTHSGLAGNAIEGATIPAHNLDSAHRLARLLQALEDCDRDFQDIRADFKARRETLQKQIWILRSNILSGQEDLPLEDVVA